jgi:hypothetical protein
VGCQESKIFMNRRFHPLGYGVKGKNIKNEKMKNKIYVQENETVLGEETFQMFPINKQH